MPMRLLIPNLPCSTCLKEHKNSFKLFTLSESTDDGFYEVFCNHGHRSQVALLQEKFELLFDMGANAILDGYYIEAIASFTSSLERFYEFCIKLFCEKRGVDHLTYEKIWKLMSRQSERQLGAFLSLWVTEFLETPNLLSNNDIEFRNSVIHKGKIPTKVESLDYGNKILEIIRPKILKLKSNLFEEIESVRNNHVRSRFKFKTIGASRGTVSLSTILSLTNEDKKHKEQTLEDALLSIELQRDAIKSIESLNL